MELVAGIVGRVDLALVLIEDADVLDRPAKMLVRRSCASRRIDGRTELRRNVERIVRHRVDVRIDALGRPWALIGTVHVDFDDLRQARQARATGGPDPGYRACDVIVPGSPPNDRARARSSHVVDADPARRNLPFAVLAHVPRSADARRDLVTPPEADWVGDLDPFLLGAERRE